MLRLLIAHTILLFAAEAQEPSTLTGVVQDSAGWKVLNSQVSIRLAGQKKVVGTAITNHSGVFLLSNLEPRTYDVCFASAGHVGICETSVVLKPGLNHLGQIRLQRDIQGGISIGAPAPQP